MRELALIIEDDQDLSEIFSQALRAAGFETEIIEDGFIAQQRIPTLTPQVVILDMHLPNVSGDALAEQIRNDARLAKTQIVVVTADPAMGRDMRKVANVVLIKPTTYSQLRELTLYMRRARPHTAAR